MSTSCPNLGITILGIVLLSASAACSPAQKTYDYTFSQQAFSDSLEKTSEVQGKGQVERPLPDDWSQREPVILQLGIDDCLDLASERNRDLLIEQLNVELARTNVLQEQAFTDPIFDATADIDRDEEEIQDRFSGDDRDVDLTTRYIAGAGVRLPFFTGTTVNVRHGLRRITTNSPFTSFEWSSDFSVSVTQNLLDGYGSVGNRANLDAAMREADAASADYRQRQNVIRFEIAQAYWNLVLAYEDLAVLRSQVDTARDGVNRTKREQNADRATQLDVLRAEATLTDRERDIIDAELAVARASDELLRAIVPNVLYGYQLKKNFKISVEPADSLSDAAERDPVPNVFTELQRAFNQRNDLVAARERLEAAGIRIRNAEQGVLPRLDLEIRADVRGFGDSYDEALTEATEGDSRGIGLGLTFEMPINNRGDRASRDRAKHQRQQAVLRYREAETQIIADVVDAIREIESNQRSVVAAREQLRLAEAELDAIQRRGRVGLTTSFEIKETQDDRAAAERDLTRARVQLQLARLRLLRATGSFGQ